MQLKVCFSLLKVLAVLLAGMWLWPGLKQSVLFRFRSVSADVCIYIAGVVAEELLIKSLGSQETSILVQTIER